jgi:anti-anti-sigma regulatory factor
LDPPEPPPRPTVLRIDGRIDPTDVEPLCARVRALLAAGGADLVVCDLSGLVRPDAVTVDALARMQLTALRLGYTIRIRAACPALAELLTMTGLGDVVTPVPE